MKMKHIEHREEKSPAPKFGVHEEYLLITFNKKDDNCLQMKRFQFTKRENQCT